MIDHLPRAIYPFRVKIATWASEITIRAYDEEDAVLLTQILFKIPSVVKITATPRETEG